MCARCAAEMEAVFVHGDVVAFVPCKGSYGIAGADSAVLSAPVAVEARRHEAETEAEAEAGRGRASVVEARRRHKADRAWMVNSQFHL